MRSLLLGACLLFLSHTTSSQEFKKKYKGLVGPYPVSMTLTARGGNLTGTYYYDKFTDPISIRGFISGKEIQFTGYDLKGNKIDHFLGQYNMYDISGIWIEENSQKKIPFKLKEEIIIPAKVDNKSWLYLLSAVSLILSAFFYLKYSARFDRNKKIVAWVNSLDNKIKTKILYRDLGFEFEKYMTTCLDEDNYKLLMWSSDKFNQGKYNADKKPNLEFEARNSSDGKNVFTIQCNYQSDADDNKINLGKRNKVQEFKSYSRIYNKPVFIAIGLGGKPSNPESVYVVPVDKLNNDLVDLNDLSQFRISGKKLNYDPDNTSLSDGA